VHTGWFHNKIDACFVPTDTVRKVALKRGVAPTKIRQYGLPVRADFWEARDAKDKLAGRGKRLCKQLDLVPDKRTVLVIGGGDGVGNLEKIVEATASKLARECPGTAQVVALCGKNALVKENLEAKKAKGTWDGVDVAVRGFTSEVSSYMEVADCLVTKAGPGTIAEAAIRGLPTMLSSFLPGQEAGNVPYVINHGFGEFSRKPAKIAERVSAWLQDDALLEKMRASAVAAATPEATQQIASDLLQLMDAHGKHSEAKA